jgi:RimJ/RimL family protein N-acetyltransferase
MITLQTPRLLFREFVLEDADALALVLSDPETMRYYPAPFDRAGVEQWIARNRERYENDGVGLWALVLKSKTGDADTSASAGNSGTARTRTGVSAPHGLIGDCGIVRQVVEGETLYEIGYHLRRDLWGQGLATEAARACRDWGFQNLKVERLISLIRPENVASRRVAERNGMTVRKEGDWRGTAHCVYSIERGQTPKAEF